MSRIFCVIVLLVLSTTITVPVDAKKIQQTCFKDSDCPSALCFFGSRPMIGVPGTCHCNHNTNTGCNNGESCIMINPDKPPVCTVCGDPTKPCRENWHDCRKLELGGCDLISEKEVCPMEFACQDKGALELGSHCKSHVECQSGACSELASLGQRRQCVCNIDTNAGCSKHETCVTLAGKTRPSCVLDLGSPCRAQESFMCLSGFCFKGICQCNPIMHFGCAESQECVGDATVGYHCSEPDTLLPIGAPCDFYNAVCETNRCFFNYWSREGHCSCNTETDEGCPAGLECVVDVENDGPPFCALPDGAACTLEGQVDCSNGTCCKSGICESGNCATAPLKQFGSMCRENSDCDTEYCYHGFQLPDTPGTCQCNPTTNGGCPEGLTCTISDQVSDTPPFCGLPLGSLCNTEYFYECSSQHCFDGTCQCALWFNSGCNEPQICVGDEIVGYKCVDPYDEDDVPLKTAPAPVTKDPTNFPAAATDPLDSSATRQGQWNLLCFVLLSSFLVL